MINTALESVKKTVDVDSSIETLTDKQKKLDSLHELRAQKEQEVVELKEQIFKLQEEIISTQN